MKMKYGKNSVIKFTAERGSDMKEYEVSVRVPLSSNEGYVVNYKGGVARLNMNDNGSVYSMTTMNGTRLMTVCKNGWVL